ncbi:MAG: ECF transporter S component [Syntrophomonadaceae bacterium]|nr:ECF transporter S component [Syntrophomonadaceae bacterium]MDD3022317.1 ECF transporter S component [Syntrophomonadaceae bacterium]
MSRKYIALAVILILLFMSSFFPANPLYRINWALLSTIIVVCSLLWFFGKFDKGQITAKEIALIATMASLAAITRIVFSPIASFKPTTFIIMISGYVFGARTGFMVGAVTALASNFFLGQGPWTPWQMLCWGLCGVLAGVLGNKQKDYHALSFIILTGACGYLYGWLLNIWHWVAFIYPLNIKTLLAVYVASFAFDSLHAAGSIVFASIFGKPFYQILRRYRKLL